MEPTKLNGKILLVDDSDTQRKLLNAVLTSTGLEVVEYDDPAKILSEIDSVKPDIIITDYEMPNMNGNELCRRIKSIESLKTIPVLVLSSHEDDSYILECIQSGATDYLPKKMNHEIMIARIRSILLAQKGIATLIEMERVRTYNATVISIKHEMNNTLAVTKLSMDSISMFLDKNLDEIQKRNLKRFESSLTRLTNAIAELQTMSNVDFTNYNSRSEMVNVKK